MATATKARRKDTAAPAESGAAPVADPTPADTGPEPTPTPAAGRPNGARDHMKVSLVAEVLDEQPDGIAAADLVPLSELQPIVVGRVLAAMEAAGAARREVDPEGTERWFRGSSDLAGVDLSTAPVDGVCPTCKQVWRVQVGGSRQRRPAGNSEPRINADGTAPLRKGELTAMVRDWMSQTDQPYTIATLTAALADKHKRPSLSQGAVRENVNKLMGSELQSANPDDPHDPRFVWSGA